MLLIALLVVAALLLALLITVRVVPLIVLFAWWAWLIALLVPLLIAALLTLLTLLAWVALIVTSFALTAVLVVPAFVLRGLFSGRGNSCVLFFGGSLLGLVLPVGFDAWSASATLLAVTGVKAVVGVIGPLLLSTGAFIRPLVLCG